MTVHYHGTPITPRRELLTLDGEAFCVSFERPDDIEACAQLGPLMLDNGAYSAWKRRAAIDWHAYHEWCERWLLPDAWAVIPDTITGSEAENDQLIEAWPHGDRGVPVWHMHESIGRLLRLCAAWPRVCLGSSAAYAKIGTRHWHYRMIDAMNALCGNGPPPTSLHMLRGMALSDGHPYPFASVDSTDVAVNHHRTHNTARKLADRWSRCHCPTRLDSS